MSKRNALQAGRVRVLKTEAEVSSETMAHYVNTWHHIRGTSRICFHGSTTSNFTSCEVVWDEFQQASTGFNRLQQASVLHSPLRVPGTGPPSQYLPRLIRSCRRISVEVLSQSIIVCCHYEVTDFLKNCVFWDVTPCGSCKFLRNVGSYKSHTALYPRRHNSS
jgi:hypothetical protein